ncbi:MAG: hypothetical protein H7251_15820 [Acetobacteraceae bacterium]|nr:hypothetical protein [Acetobacteraceae bacterium]
MNKLILGLMASAALGICMPTAASAHPDEDAYQQQDDWNNGGDSYAEFDQEYRHIWNGIQHGLNDGSYTPREANYFYRQMQIIRAKADWQARRGYYDGGRIQASLEQLHDRMHNAHGRGHEREDWYGSGYRGYGYGQPSTYADPYGDRYRSQDQGFSVYFGTRR